MKGRRASVITLAICVLLGSIALPVLGAGTALADDDDDIPGLPGVYHGDIEVVDGDFSGPVLVEAVADGEVQDTLLTDEDGAIGGSTIADDKLEVQEPEDGEVEFHIGGSPVTIATLDGESVNDDSIEFAEGDQEITLEVEADDLAPSLELSIDETNDPVDAGDDLTVEVTATNDGPAEVSQDIELLDFDDDVVDTDSVTVPIGEEASTTLTWSTDDELDGSGTITVQSGESSASATVEVEQDGPPDVADPDPGGGASPPSGGDDGDAGDGDNGDADDGDADPAEDVADGVVYIEEQEIASSEEFEVSQVRFTDEASVESITWDGTEFNGSVAVSTFEDTPNETTAAPGTAATIAQISVPDDVRDESATVQLRVADDQLDAADADADDLRIFRFVDGEWDALETEVAEDTADGVVVQAETPGFSYFAVSAVSEPTAEISVSPQDPVVGDDVTLDGSDSMTEHGELVSYEWTIAGDSHDGEVTSTAFDEAGDVDVELTVENDAGETDTVTSTVSVTEETATETETPTEDTPDPGEDDSTDEGIPGFTGGLALVALLISGLLASRRLN